MNEIPPKYQKLVERIKKACNQLKWVFDFKTDLMKRFEVEDGIAFRIDGVEYLVGCLEKIVEWPITEYLYNISTVITYSGNREEPPSEDEKVLNSFDCFIPENLLHCLLNAHSNVRLNWVMESMVEDMELEDRIDNK